MALITVAADKGAPGVTTTALALAAVWPRPCLLAECDPAGGDLVYWLPGADGGRLDPRRGLVSLAVAARRGPPSRVWEHAQKLRCGLDVLLGVASAEQGSGLDPLWAAIGGALAALPQADVIADCGRLGADGPYYDLLARAAAITLVLRPSLGDVVRVRDRAAALSAAVRDRGGRGGPVGLLVVADHRRFSRALAEVGQAMARGDSAVSVLGGIAYEPKGAELLRGDWIGKVDKSLLIRTARQAAGRLASSWPAATGASDPELAHPGPAAAALANDTESRGGPPWAVLSDAAKRAPAPAGAGSARPRPSGAGLAGAGPAGARPQKPPGRGRHAQGRGDTGARGAGAHAADACAADDRTTGRGE
jgi:hypothetical protein